MRRMTALLIAGLFAASLAAPAGVMAKPSNTYTVGLPNGHDDTAAVQAGLDFCANYHGPNCTVQLQAGKYLSSLLLEKNFNGTFKGAGEGQTTIQALPNLLVSFTPGCLPNLTDCRYPTFITFIDGNVEVSDLALDFTGAAPGQETTLYSIWGGQSIGLVTGLEFTGVAGSASVDRVSVTGSADDTPTNLGVGFSVMQGIMFDGWLPAAPGSTNYATRSGTFSVRNSSVRTVWDAVIAGGALAESHVTIGGSPWAGNQITDVDFGIDVGGANSAFDVSYNQIAATNAADEQIDHAGVWVEPSGGAFAGLVGRLSQVSIHDNTIAVSDACGCGMFGMWLLDAVAGEGAPAHWFRATVLHNTISLPSTYTLSGEYKEGMDVDNITGTVISGNTFTGTSAGTADAVGLYGNDPTWPASTGNVIMGNDVSGLTPTGTQFDPVDYPGLGLSQYYLDQYTNHNLVACTRRADTAINAGTANAVIGCTPVPVPAAVAQGVTPLVRPTSPMGRFKLPPQYPVHP
ncbi:MAG: hypothetical protein P4M09_21700 [Devosia sp.]|nr:hypothetical protein [Devosia sp.]